MRDRICKEKMFPVMGCLGYDNFEEALRIAKTNLNMKVTVIQPEFIPTIRPM